MEKPRHTNLNKETLASIIHKKLGLSNVISIKIVNDLLNIFNDNIKIGNLNLKNFGTFKLINKNERVGRNPKTGETHLIKKRKFVSFIVSKNLDK